MLHLLCEFAQYKDDAFVQRTRELEKGVKFLAVIDACYAGGMSKDPLSLIAKKYKEEKYSTPNKMFASPSLRRQLVSRDVIDPLSAAPIVYVNRFGGNTVALSARGNVVSEKTTFNNPSDENGPSLNGVMVSACQENETAAAGSELTTGLSAFTFAWLKAYQASPEASIAKIGASTGAILAELGYRQTPRIDGVPSSLDLTFAKLLEPVMHFAREVWKSQLYFIVHLVWNPLDGKAQDLSHQLSQRRDPPGMGVLRVLSHADGTGGAAA